MEALKLAASDMQMMMLAGMTFRQVLANDLVILFALLLYSRDALRFFPFFRRADWMPSTMS